MGFFDSPITVIKGTASRLYRLLKTVVRAPIRGPKRLVATIKGLRTLSPVTAALAGVVILLASIVGVGVFFAAQSSWEVSGSSAPVLSTFLEWMTSGWGYVLAALVFGQGSVWGIRRRLISMSAGESGYRPRVIERMGEEIRSTDGTTRVIAFADDPVDELAERIETAFGSGDDDILRLEDDDAADQETDSASNLPVPAREVLPATTDSRFGKYPPEQQLSRPERFALWRKDLASAIQTNTLIWRFLVPTGILLAIELILVRFWVAVWVYPVLVAGALLGGIGVWRTTLWFRRRRLRSLREDHSHDIYDEISVLVKTVDTDDLTIHMGFLAGRRYASRDREQLAETLAERALERCQGKQPAPAIEERFAWCLERYIVDFEGWRENREKPEIMDQLVTEVLEAEEGMLPKEVLAHRVVEHDRKYIWQGLRFVGYGYDPRLVAEAYDDLEPAALVEREVKIDRPDEETTTLTAVRARTETLPPDVAQIRANFSERFPTRKLPERYDLPEADRGEMATPYTIPKEVTAGE